MSVSKTDKDACLPNASIPKRQDAIGINTSNTCSLLEGNRHCEHRASRARWGRLDIFKARLGFTEKVTSEWTWERAEGICRVNIWQKNILAGDPAKMKALQLHCDWNILAEVSVAGVEWAKVRVERRPGGEVMVDSGSGWVLPKPLTYDLHETVMAASLRGVTFFWWTFLKITVTVWRLDCTGEKGRGWNW